MSILLTIAVIALIFIVIFQIAKASEYVTVLRGEGKGLRQSNKINGALMITFLVLGLVGVWYCNDLYFGKTLLAYDAASVEGARVDSMMWMTIAVTGFVFIITQIILFYFAYKYQQNDEGKVYYFAHNNKLEFIWTIIPAIVLTVLVVVGLRNWFLFTGEPCKFFHHSIQFFLVAKTVNDKTCCINSYDTMNRSELLWKEWLNYCCAYPSCKASAAACSAW